MQNPENLFVHERNPDLHSTVEVEAIAEYLPVNNEQSPEQAASMGRVAIAAELIEAREADVQQLESERKINTNENLNSLQKRFGERFVKGDLMEGGGYTGGAARELLAGFMDHPGFANELKRLIPGKHGALQLLKDNHTYIQATLEQWNKDDPSHEKAPVKDPYELARSAGYELTGPFTSTDEFVLLDKRDFRQNERLCTFNSPAERLKGYNILWLRHAEVDDTLPADQLTANTLSDAWKTYLKTIGRYDRDSDSYDLSGLRPTRDDPYGTSSMSVQISRQGAHVSIKNRYNHTVGNPDNTLDSDLDNVAYGLKRAVYQRVGREDLNNKTSAVLAEGYIADNDGGIHHYKYEEDNVHYGDYEYINNGVVTTIDRGAYYMISPQIYVPKSGKGNDIRLGQRAVGITRLEISSDVRFLYNNSTNRNEKDPRVAELRLAYAERDYDELKKLSTERIKQHFDISFAAYNTAYEALGKIGVDAKSQLTPEQANKLYVDTLEKWQQNGILAYTAERLISHGELYNPVMTPNLLLQPVQIQRLAIEFGDDQPEGTYVDKDLYNMYSAQELSGYDQTAGAATLSLIPNKFTAELNGLTADNQQLILERFTQVAQPKLGHHIPSVLTSVMHWYTLRAGGDTLSTGNVWVRTGVRHIDLQAQLLYGSRVLPRSRVRNFGGPLFYDSRAGDGDRARVAVGKKS